MRGASGWEARDRATAAAWERFAAGGDITGITTSPCGLEILRSWQRCRDDYKIDPASPARRPPTTTASTRWPASGS